MAEPLVLGFDTSAAHCAAALVSGGAVIAARHDDMAKGQAEHLMPMLADLLASAGADWGDLAALGVGIGPGNFTGIRISVAAARGLALGLGIPAYGISTFEAMALDAPRPLTVVIDARRGQIYSQNFDADGATPRMHLADGFQPPHPVVALPGVADHAAPPRHDIGPAVALIAAGHLRAGRPAARPAPLYIRPADAAPPSEPAPVIVP